ncbi:MAG: DUF1015 domain-containing protein [Candidatus Sericytochromatia bacterium]|nr:DUF1015 domain-containing protein [Candidatus Sericytochromatia bacterium]
MPDIRPFRALRYSFSRLEEPGAVLCPPYDVVSQQDQIRLHLRHPLNAIRLELGRDQEGDSGEENRYHRAARTLLEWRGEGTVTQDEAPSFYLHRHDGSWGSRLGLFGGLVLQPWGHEVRPHERTLNGPKADRLLLFRHVGASLSPVLMLVGDPDGELLALWHEVMTETEPLVTLEDGCESHVLWAIPPGSRQERLRSMLAERPLTVADGHHRYETALAYRNEGAEGKSEGDPSPRDLGFVCLARLEDPALVVLPTHRLLKPALPALAELLTRLRQDFEVVEEPWNEDPVHPAEAMGQWVDELTAKGAFGMLMPGESRRWVLSPSPDLLARLATSTGTEALARLSVVQLHHGLLAPVLGHNEASWAKGGDLSYTREGQEVLIGLASGSFGAAFVLPRPTASGVADVAAAGAVMPQKSTYFEPKVPTGLLFMDLGGPSAGAGAP